MRIARLSGIPVRVDWSWLLVFGLLVWSLAIPQWPFTGVAAAWRFPVAAAIVVVLFACVAAHEAAHVLAARRCDIATRRIDLFVFGGVSQFEAPAASAAQAARIALAGPAASVASAVFFCCISLISGFDATVQSAAAYLSLINAGLAALNLLPAYPLDGGRLFHAVIWRMGADRELANRVAAAATTLIGLAAAFGGLLLIAEDSLFAGMWVAVLAWFVMRVAQSEMAFESAVTPLAELRAGNVADAAPHPAEPDVTCETALERMVRSRQRVLPVCIGGRLLGLVTLSDFTKLGRRAPDTAYVAAIMTPAERLVTLAADVPALEAFKLLAQSGYRQLPVLNGGGGLAGFIDHETVARALAIGLARGGVAGPALSRLN